MSDGDEKRHSWLGREGPLARNIFRRMLGLLVAAALAVATKVWLGPVDERDPGASSLGTAGSQEPQDQLAQGFYFSRQPTPESQLDGSEAWTHRFSEPRGEVQTVIRNGALVAGTFRFIAVPRELAELADFRAIVAKGFASKVPTSERPQKGVRPMGAVTMLDRLALESFLRGSGCFPDGRGQMEWVVAAIGKVAVDPTAVVPRYDAGSRILDCQYDLTAKELRLSVTVK